MSLGKRRQGSWVKDCEAWEVGGRRPSSYVWDLGACLFFSGISLTIKAPHMSVAGIFCSLLIRIAHHYPPAMAQADIQDCFEICHAIFPVGEKT